MHVLVTGGAGFIGSQLVEYHLNKGDKVHAVDNFNTGSLENIKNFKGNPNFHFNEVDIITWKELGKAISWADRIYHMAAIVGMFKVLEDPTKVLAVNIGATEKLLHSALSGGWNPQIIIASTSEVYGARRESKFEETEELTFCAGGCSRWTYALSKLIDEVMGISFFRKYDMNITILRLFNTIGPRQTGIYGMVAPRFVEQAQSGRPITIFGDGAQTRSFCDVRDTVVAMDLLASCPGCRGEIFNLGHDREISILELAKMVKKISKSESPIEFVSYKKAYGQDFVDVPRRRPDLRKLRKYLDFEHKWKLEDTLEYLINSKNPDSKFQ